MLSCSTRPPTVAVSCKRPESSGALALASDVVCMLVEVGEVDNELFVMLVTLARGVRTGALAAGCTFE